ncbi:hypothetical protein ACM614_01645 [Streptomyces sp. 12297]
MKSSRRTSVPEHARGEREGAGVPLARELRGRAAPAGSPDRQDRLTVRQPEGGQLQAFLADLAQNEHLHLAGGDPFLTTVLRSGSDVFIDRADLRRRLKEFTEDPEKTVFVVDGDPGTGRSYTFT